MTTPSDYMGGMALSVTEREAEALLTRSGDVGDDLIEVAVILDALHAAALPALNEDFSPLFEAAVRESRLTPIERFANEQIMITDDWKPRVMPRLAIGALALFALVTMSTGLAYAANGAAPGDLLYGIDRALEAVGIGDGGAGERLAEAQALVAAGDAAGGLTVTTQALQLQNEQASEAIAEAAARIAGEPANEATKEAVQDLLDYIHDNQTDIDSDMVVEYAHKIGNRPEDPGHSGEAPGQQDTPANEVAPGQTKEPGTSAKDEAPGQQDGDEATVTDDTEADDGAPGNSGNAPGHDENGPGNSENAPGHQEDESPSTSSAATTGTTSPPGNSGSAPDQGGTNPGNGPESGGPPGQGGGG